MKKNQFFTFLIIFLMGHNLQLTAQAISREEYLQYLPLEYPRIIEQTRASVELQIYGDKEDPAYRDDEPLNGIDDRRDIIFEQIAVRFAPYLIQNTTSAPIDFRVFMEGRSAFPLYIDTWNIASPKYELVGTDLIDFSSLGESDCRPAEFVGDSSEFSRYHNMNNDDCKLLALIEEFDPRDPKNDKFGNSVQNPERDLFKVIYFDFPGDGPETWREEFEHFYTRQLPEKYQGFLKTYMHPFLIDHISRRDKTLLGYEIILQYWFFYPYNDGGNNHEGDWEHINVVISPKNRVETYLSAEEVQTVLEGSWLGREGQEDELVIKRIENYFHHFVMPLDFSSPNVYQPRDEWEAEIDTRPETSFGENDLLRKIRYRAYTDDAETRINTHPFIYCGGDNKGLDQVMQMPGGTNRDSHGSYPFSGMYKGIGPAGATEQISSHTDHRAYLLNLDKEGEAGPPGFKRGNVIGFNRPDRVEVVPDWERVIDLTRTNAEARHRWSWLFLPLRWGYPATESPFAGIVKHVDTGNVGDIGPAFWDGWNRSMGTPGAEVYRPNQIPPLFPLGLQDSFDNSLGFFNLTYPALSNLPPFDFIWRFAAYPFRAVFGREDPVYYAEKGIPFRFVDLAGGVSSQTLDPQYKSVIINNTQFAEFYARLLFHIIINGGDTTTVVTNYTESLEKPTAPIFQVIFHIGDHFSSENSLRNFRSNYGFTASFNNIPAYRYQAELNFWEYAGSLRYNIFTSNLRPYVKLGYGWSWYRLENVMTNGQIFDNPNSEWFNQPSFDSFSSVLPNTWHWGVGIELILLKSFAEFPEGIDLSMRAEYGVFYNSLGLDLSRFSLSDLALAFPTLGDVPQSGSVSRKNFNLVFSLSY